MGLINIEDVRPGMILGADVKDQNGRILLTSGHELTDRHVKIFKMWGVIEAEIQGVDREAIAEQSLADLDPAALELAEQKATELFRHADTENPVVKELFRLCTMRMVRETSGGPVHAG